MLQKLKNRIKFINDAEEKSRLAESLNITLISSEESEDESDNLVVRPLLWRSPEVTNFMKELDRRCEQKQLGDRRKQNARRKLGGFSDRSCDGVPAGIKWAVVDDEAELQDIPEPL